MTDDDKERPNPYLDYVMTRERREAAELAAARAEIARLAAQHEADKERIESLYKGGIQAWANADSGIRPTKLLMAEKLVEEIRSGSYSHTRDGLLFAFDITDDEAAAAIARFRKEEPDPPTPEAPAAPVVPLMDRVGNLSADNAALRDRLAALETAARPFAKLLSANSPLKDTALAGVSFTRQPTRRERSDNQTVSAANVRALRDAIKAAS